MRQGFLTNLRNPERLDSPRRLSSRVTFSPVYLSEHENKVYVLASGRFSVLKRVLSVRQDIISVLWKWESGVSKANSNAPAPPQKQQRATGSSFLKNLYHHHTVLFFNRAGGQRLRFSVCFSVSVSSSRSRTFMHLGHVEVVQHLQDILCISVA